MLRNIALAAVLAVAGCYTEAEVAYPYGPDLAYVAPGVEVVASSDYPVFFVDGWYWRWDAGYWYRSAYWDHAWMPAVVIPVGIRGIVRPWSYAHYRPAPGGYIVHRGGGVHRR